MHYEIDGRSALIVGGSMGIGFEAAKLLAEPAGYITGNWIEVDGGLHRSAF